VKSVALHNLGCKVNSYELDVMQQNLLQNGFLIVPFDQVADIYIVNTCTVTNIADHKSKKMLNRARQKNPRAVVVAVGCLVEASEEEIENLPIDLAIGNNRKNELVPILRAFFKERKKIYPKVVEAKADNLYLEKSTYEEMQLKKSWHTRAFIKIQDGCNQFCSYCIIPYVRGRARSRPALSIMKELTVLVKKGCREIVLTGINLSAYGLDFSDDNNAFVNLLKEIHNIPGLSRIRLSSLEPRLITHEFINELILLPKICPHFHLSLQSGCDSVLERMNRRYTSAEYYEKMEMIRAAYKNKHGREAAITTDVIVGFPGETEAEFAETEDFVRRAGFAKIHVFRYSKRKETKASSMPDQIAAPTKKERSLKLHKIGKESAKQFLRSYLGKDVTVILEEEKIMYGEAYWLGYTAEYIRTGIAKSAFAGMQASPGLLVNAVMTGFLAAEIMKAQLVNW